MLSSFILTQVDRFYQEYLGKSLTDKYTKLNLHLDKVVHNANSEISSLHSKLAGMFLITEHPIAVSDIEDRDADSPRTAAK